MRFITRPACACAAYPLRRTAYARPSLPTLRAIRLEPLVGDDDAIRCDACPVLCYIKPGRTGSCDRYANHDGRLVRLDPHVLLDQAVSRGESVVQFLEHSQDWNGNLVNQAGTFVTVIGA